ncbi:MAG: hypothetical protein ABJF79_11630 [Paracoccaceae bacterium]
MASVAAGWMLAALGVLKIVAVVICGAVLCMVVIWWYRKST